MADSNIQTLAPGTVVAGARQYVIERVLGEGGFGITYLAVTQVQIGNVTVPKRVALKEHFMSDHNERDADTMRVTTPGTARSRQIVADSMRDFLGEARRLQQLGAGHPNIVKVNEVFEANGTAYYVMEYLEGASLWSAIEGRGMAEADMRAVMLPIVDAVAYLHTNRLTHLDIKPQNIMLAAEMEGTARPVLIDFGLSKHYDAQGHATSTVNTLACSDGYSPVEQYSGITTFTPAADVYALGATMIACLTGSTPPKSTDWSAGRRLQYVDSMNISEPLRAALRGALADIENRIPDAAALANVFAGSATRTPGGEVFNLPTPSMVSSNSTRPVERRFLSEESASRLSTAGPTPVTPSNATRLSSSSPKPAVGTRLSLILIALAAVAIGAGAYFAFRSGGPEPQPAPAPADTLAIAQNLETVEIETPAPQPTPQPTPQPQPTPEPAPQPQPNPQPAPQPTPVPQPQPAPQRQQEETPVQSQSNSVWQNHREPRNLYLAVERDGNQYYFSQSDWSNLPAAQKGECRKLGVVINNEGERFILALEDAPGFYTWEEAMSRFGNRLPTKKQGEAWINQQEAVQSAIRAFGGHITGRDVEDDNYPESDYRRYYWYWTRTSFESDSPTAWNVTVKGGYVNSGGIKGKPSRVRPVAPVAVPAI